MKIELPNNVKYKIYYLSANGKQAEIQLGEINSIEIMEDYVRIHFALLINNRMCRGFSLPDEAVGEVIFLEKELAEKKKNEIENS